MTNDLEKLREEIGELFKDAHWIECGMWTDEDSKEYADKVLNHPQIADLLRMKAIQVVPSGASRSPQS